MKKIQLIHRNRPNGKKLRVSKKTAEGKAESAARIDTIVRGEAKIRAFINRGILIADKAACQGYSVSGNLPRQPALKVGFMEAMMRTLHKLVGKKDD